MNIDEAIKKSSVDGTSWLDTYLNLGKREGLKIEFEDKIKDIFKLEENKRRNEAIKQQSDYQNYLNSGSLRKSSEYKQVIALNRKKIQLTNEVRAEKKALEDLHRKYISALDMLRNFENGVNVFDISIDAIEYSRKVVRENEKEREFKLANVKALNDDFLRVEGELRTAQREVKKLYAKEQAPLLSELETLLKRADEINEKMKFSHTQIHDAMPVPGFHISGFSNKANTVLKTGSEFVNLYK